MFQKLCSVLPMFRRDKNKLQFVKIACSGVSGVPDYLVVSFRGDISGILKTLEQAFNTKKSIIELFHSIDFQDLVTQGSPDTEIHYEIVWDDETGNWNLKSFK